MFPSLARIDAPNSEVKLRSMYPQIVERSTLRSIAVSGGIFTMLQRVGQSERLSIRDGSASLIATCTPSTNGIRRTTRSSIRAPYGCDSCPTLLATIDAEHTVTVYFFGLRESQDGSLGGKHGACDRPTVSGAMGGR